MVIRLISVILFIGIFSCKSHYSFDFDNIDAMEISNLLSEIERFEDKINLKKNMKIANRNILLIKVEFIFYILAYMRIV